MTMKLMFYTTIVISSILAFALISSISTIAASAIVHEDLMEEDQGGNMTQGQGEEISGMTEGQMIPMVKKE
jgi:hypothetical protein